eukprot:COSAG01_NODE_3863_length_5621_cov_2.450970_8_plen_183_part_00
MVVAFASEEMNVYEPGLVCMPSRARACLPSASALVKTCSPGRYKINAALSKRGYHMAGCQAPPCVHLALTLRHVGPVMDEICAALEAAVEEVRAAPRIEGEAEATVGIYGSEAEVSEPRLLIPPPLPASLHPVRAHRPLGARTHTQASLAVPCLRIRGAASSRARNSSAECLPICPSLLQHY